jgi:hypothetical protein
MTNDLSPNKPPYRKLRGYAFDPVSSLNMETAAVNQITYKVPWEDNLQKGPEGEYIKVIDRDPASGAVYKPVNLNEPAHLAADGLSPSETNPQFHQQMVYAVVMSTIKNFEKALGRKAMWSPVEKFDRNNKRYFDFVEKLLVYPHAIRDQNAYYSPERKALLFGYYNATPVDAGIFLPGGIVYSCLSHDIIAHETTHALLDGMYSRLMEATHPDVSGFHEGFADIVALLMHFTYPDILKHQVRAVRGALDTENMLSKLAVEFGQSTGEYRSLRDAIGRTDENGKWIRNTPTTGDYESNLECHDRGALLVSAVFDAFIAIYKNRTADLVRLATGGTGNVPPGEIHPDLVNRLAGEASKVASHLCNMCIRALDYCPPLDLTFGDYLRGLITADKELVENDEYNYRVAFINAFRKRGIFPEGVPNLSVDTLCYNSLEHEKDKTGFTREVAGFLRAFKEKMTYQTDRRKIHEGTAAFIRGDFTDKMKGLYRFLFDEGGVAKDPVAFENLTGLVFSGQYRNLGIGTSASMKKGPSIEVHSLRLNNRVGPDGNMLNQIVLTLAQRCTVAVTHDRKKGTAFVPVRRGSKMNRKEDRFTFRGGCTLIFDLDDMVLKHAIRKPIFDPSHLKAGSNRTLTLNQQRLRMQYRCQFGDLVDKIGFAPPGSNVTEPLAFVHRDKNLLL